MAARERSESGLARRGGCLYPPVARPSPIARVAAAGLGGQGIRDLPEVSAGLPAAEAENRNCRSGSRPVGDFLSSSATMRKTFVFKQTCTNVQVCASVLFFWTVHGPFSFRQDRKENGGWIDPAIIMAVSPVPARAPARPPSRPFPGPPPAGCIGTSRHRGCMPRPIGRSYA